MNRIATIALLWAISIFTVKAQTNQHRFACADYTQGKVFIVSGQGKVEWEYPAPACDDMSALPNGNLLFAVGHGVREVTPKKEVVFQYDSTSEIFACQRLENGDTFIAECTAGRLLEVNPKGKITKELRLLPEGKDGGHLFIRNCRKLANGNYLVTHYAEQVVREYDPAGKIVRSIQAEGGPHSAVRLPNGNTLISCGDLKGAGRIFETDAKGSVVWQVQGDDLPGISLKFVAGMHRLPNGNTVFCNWLGHDHFKEGPHLVEVTPQKKVVWTYGNHDTMRTIVTVQVLDFSAGSFGSEIWH